MNDTYSINEGWKLHCSCSVQEAAALIAGYEPNKFYFSDDTHLHQKDVFLEISNDSIAAGVEHKSHCEEAIKVKVVYSALKNSIKDKTLNAKLGYLTYSGYEMRLKNADLDDKNLPLDPIKKDEFFLNSIIDWSETTVTYEDLKQWMLSKNFTSSEFFFGKQANTPDYLNPNHPRYTKKLAATVTAWQSVTDAKGKSPKDALKKWLREHAAEYGLTDDEGKLQETVIEELGKVANWKPEGGASLTPTHSRLPPP
jgi:hypothetical protein